MPGNKIVRETWSLEQVKEYLVQHQIRPSFYRLKIFFYLINEKTHPTAEEILKYLYKEIPAISRATIYNTLRLFLEKGVVQLVSVEKEEARYDATLFWHGHFKCLRCGKIFDFPVEALKFGGLDGFVIREKQLELKGVCPSCVTEKKEID